MILFNLADEGVKLLRRGCTVSSDGTVQFSPSLLFIQNGRGVQFGATYSFDQTVNDRAGFGTFDGVGEQPVFFAR